MIVRAGSFSQTNFVLHEAQGAKRIKQYVSDEATLCGAKLGRLK